VNNSGYYTSNTVDEAPRLAVRMAPVDAFHDESIVYIFRPAHYVEPEVTAVDVNIVSIFWGAALMLGVFAAAKAVRHTQRSWNRHRRLRAYIIMIWGAWWTNMIPSAVTWLHFWGEIPSRYVCMCGPRVVYVHLQYRKAMSPPCVVLGSWND
jgi:hypothetical protein